MPERNITFEIREHLGTIAKYETGWRKELNIISWNGGTAKFDIRDWDEGHVKMGKGITLSLWEMRKMVDLYISRNNERAIARGRAIEEERNALRAASFRPRQTESELDDGTGMQTAFEPESLQETAATEAETAAEPEAETAPASEEETDTAFVEPEEKSEAPF